MELMFPEKKYENMLINDFKLILNRLHKKAILMSGFNDGWLIFQIINHLHK